MAYVTADQDNDKVLKGVQMGSYKIVFLTPEMLLLNKQWHCLLASQVYKANLQALVVDEAHTVKKWQVFVQLLTLCRILI